METLSFKFFSVSAIIGTCLYGFWYYYNLETEDKEEKFVLKVLSNEHWIVQYFRDYNIKKIIYRDGIEYTRESLNSEGFELNLNTNKNPFIMNRICQETPNIASIEFESGEVYTNTLYSIEESFEDDYE